MENLSALNEKISEITSLDQAVSVLGWDQQTNMPPGGAEARANQLAALQKVVHEMRTADEMGTLIEKAKSDINGAPEHSAESRMVAMAERDYHLATCLPTKFVTEFARTRTLAHEVWAKAREHSDFSAFQPTLEHMVDMCRQRAEYIGYEEHIYDALLDLYEPEMKTSQVDKIFSDLREELIPFSQAIFENVDAVSDEPIHREFPVEKQREFGMRVAQALGFDLERGRQDEAVHPFCTSFSSDDVRITTRFDVDFLSPALFGTIHETGHALYEQNIGTDYAGTPLGNAISLGVHESQSRLWENVVARSYEFWEYFYGDLQEIFSGTLDDVSLDEFYGAINKVHPSFIRVEADEVTYPFHIMMRFEMEKDLMSGDLAVADAPEMWNSKMESYLGIVPENDALGILQDVHWSSGLFGYFSTYALGSLLASQLYEAALKEHPDLPQQFKQGKFETILDWMSDKVHQHGRRYLPDELIQNATGQPLSHKPFMKYVRTKFGPLYDI